MKNKIFRAFLTISALAGVVAVAPGCVADRPSRNGVFNENQYVRKAFLIRDGGDQSGVQNDTGWMLKASVVRVSTPDPLGDNFGIYVGAENTEGQGGKLVRFAVTQDKLQMLNLQEITKVADDARTPEVVNAWPITNVDLKYRINLDGEKTNFYEENQELDWQVRQWVKINFAKNDLSDVAPLGGFTNDMLTMCTDIGNASATLLPDSFKVDEPNNYMEWTANITLPLKWNDATCVSAFGELGIEAMQLGRNNVTFDLKYSLVRATPPEAITYKTLELGEKDPIRHKYGVFETITIVRDNNSGQLASRELVNRWDPQKPINWYFAKGFPDDYKKVFTTPGKPDDPTTIEGQTNQLMKDSGAAARLSFHEWNEPAADGTPIEREYGDVRYSFVRWVSDRDMQTFWAGLTPSFNDPRTGETLSATLTLNDFAIKDIYVQRVDAYLQMIGASADVNSTVKWPDLGPCKDGDVAPIVPETVLKNHNGKSSLYQKMQEYLQKPIATFGNLGPQDFIQPQDDDFFKAYYALMPYYIFADPDMNPYVIREGGAGVLGPGAFWQLLQDEAAFQKLAGDIDRGLTPYQAETGPAGLANATDFLNKFQKLTLAHKDFVYKKHFVHSGMHMDAPEAFSFEAVMAKNARHCVNGKWETKEEWTQNLISTYWSQTIWHEFGHALGLEHNFMGSIDKNNFPHYKDGQGNDHIALYANSVMEYNTAPDRLFWHPGWAPYDQGAISWIYANDKPTNPACHTSISGQSTDPPDPMCATGAPWKDPHGFTKDGKEIQYLFCSHQHLKFTPFCREGDLGTTPSEIMANAIDSYEWKYQWRNFRTYRKYWDNSAYADAPAAMIGDMRKFISLWEYDWSTGELGDSMRRIGIKNPDPQGSDLAYFTQLTNKFNAEASTANQMVAAFHKAVIQQSSGERPYKTIYDKYYGDVTQQGIILDKLLAMQGFVALWPTDNYDPNDAGAFFASYSGIGDYSYNYVAEDAVNSMIGGQYDVYPYFVPLAVAQFAQDTHSPAFGGRISVRNWIGGHVFNQLEYFLAFFREIAVQNNYAGCTNAATCAYDPRPLSDLHNEFFGPDQRLWIWAYIPDRNQWVAVQKEINTASYIIVRNYTDYVVYQLDDGSFPGGAFGAELPMKFFLDSFNGFN